MAKKSKGRKSNTRTNSKTGSKPARKTSGKAKAKPAAGSDPSAGKPVRTGAGLSPLELGQKLVADFNRGKMELSDLWSPSIVSIEGVGVSTAWHGRKAVDAKNSWWASDHRVHGASAEGPYVGATGFAIKFVIDVETRSTGKRDTMTEIGVYTVKNGKIVQEEFMYRVG
ncbi:MAG: nuclear transport factor 2 family protein [Phycisphaerales bacterium]|nr:nuclear transport factor 2 family protein [Planctomycetota bacterium]